MWLTFATVCLASDGETDPIDVAFVDAAPVFTAIAFDTGYWPSASDPIAIRLFLTPVGGVDTALYGTSEVAWPPLAHRVHGGVDGRVALDTALEIGAEVQLDLLGVFTGVVPLVTESVTFEAETAVSGLLLPAGPAPSATVTVDDPGAIPPIAYGLTVIPGVELVGAIALIPDATATMTGISVDSVVGDAELHQQADGEWIDVPPDPTRPGELGFVTTWSGELAASLALVIQPEIRVDTFLGSFTLAQFPIPVTLIDTVEPRTSAPVFAVHPLPVLGGLDDAIAFGTVSVDTTTNRELPLDNLGAQFLEGTLRIEGDPAFAVWPPSFAAAPDAASGFVVTFAPSDAGDHSTSLVIETNDPTMPLVSVPLTGTAAIGPLDGGSPSPDDEGSPITTCGCAGSAADPGWLAIGAVSAAGWASRRRRSPAAASRTSGSPRRRGRSATRARPAAGS
ncbi:MAG: hypothetical protein ABMB14_12380, partial [Myxococcota bacterium]